MPPAPTPDHPYRQKNFTQEEKASIHTLLDDGMPVSEIAMVRDCTASAIYRQQKLWEGLPPGGDYVTNRPFSDIS